MEKGCAVALFSGLRGRTCMPIDLLGVHFGERTVEGVDLAVGNKDRIGLWTEARQSTLLKIIG